MKNLIKINNNMKVLLDKLESEKENSIEVNVRELDKIILPNLVKINDCIIIDMNNRFKEKNIDLKVVLDRFGDRTGYEASCNEVRINDYIISEDYFGSVRLGKMIMEIWKNKLKLEYPKDKFCIILSADGSYVTLRFYKIRKDESPWLNEDNLEGYEDEVIMIYKF